MKPIIDFAKRFGTNLIIDRSLVAENRGRYFLLSQQMKQLARKDFFHAGAYLGKVRRGVFFPSFNLLRTIASRNSANKVMVDQKSEWLFTVGRDIFKRGILRVVGSRKKDAYTLIVNQHGECLGFGRFLHTLDGNKGRNQVIVRNVSDIGDFLRRERRV